MIQVSSVTGTRTPVLDGGQAGQNGWISARRACCAVGTNTLWVVRNIFAEHSFTELDYS